MSPINYSYNSRFFFIYKDIRIYMLSIVGYGENARKEIEDENKVEYRTKRRS